MDHVKKLVVSNLGVLQSDKEAEIENSRTISPTFAVTESGRNENPAFDLF